MPTTKLIALIAIILDLSGSMSGEKLLALKEQAKLAVAVLDGDVCFIGFSGTAEQSPVFKLGDAASRAQAMDYVDSLAIGKGGTNYLAPLQALKDLPRGTASVFVSDGENNGGTEEQVLELTRQAPGPIHTLAVQTNDTAKQLLTSMAAASGGSSVDIEDAETLTRTFLDLAQRLGNYRSLDPSELPLKLSDVSGTVIAIGYDAVPAIDGLPSSLGIYEHEAKLPVEHVFLQRGTLQEAADIEIREERKRTTTGRLAVVLRNDLARPKFTVSPSNGTVAPEGKISLKTEFFTPDGRQIDPRDRDDLKAGYVLRDGDNNVIDKQRATPHPSEPALIFTYTAPERTGPITVEQITRDTSSELPFDDRTSRTIEIKPAIRLTVLPSRLTGRFETGSFSESLELTPAEGGPIELDVEAELQQTDGELRLNRTKTEPGKLILRFEVEKPGTYEGSILIRAEATDPVSPVEPLSVPYRFEVVPKSRGLALKQDAQPHHLGTFVSNAGLATLGTLAVPSLDLHSWSYSVQVSDLSDGSQVVSTTVAPAQIKVSRDNPGKVTLSAEIDDVPAGTYTGVVAFRPEGDANDRVWHAKVAITLTDPLTVQPLDFGKVEPGGVRAAKLLIRNIGKEVPPLEIVPADAKAEGGLIEMSVPERTPVLKAGQATSIEVNLTVSPLVSSRGQHAAVLSLQRSGGRTIRVPVRLQVVDKGTIPSQLLVSPSQLKLQGTTGQPLRFDISIKIGGSAAADKLTIIGDLLKDSAGNPTDSQPEFRWIVGNAVTPSQPARAEGFLVAPLQTGTYRGQIQVQSVQQGAITVPVTVDVR